MQAPQHPHAGIDAETAIARRALRLVNSAGLANPWRFAAALPTLAEIEAEFGRYLLQQARHMEGVNHAHHSAAAAALNEVVGEVAAPDVARGLRLKSCTCALGAGGCGHVSLQIVFSSI